jgi:hypothetical protein
MAEMTEAQWAEYRAECRSTRDSSTTTPDGRSRRERRARSIERQQRRLFDDQHAS